MKHALPFLLLLFVTIGLSAQTSFRNSFSLPATASSVHPVDLKVYPNPAIDFISLTEAKGVSKVIVFNLVGRAMKNFNVSYASDQFYVGDLPKGMYLVQIKDNSDKVLTTQRLHKQ